MTVAAQAPSPSAAAFERLKGMVGTWKGDVQWTGLRTDKGELEARYSLSGYGTAVVEDLVSDGKVVMTSVYHMDGADLRMTHFCGAGNQPRLKAAEIAPDGRRVRFDFVDVTNLKTPETGHVHGASLEFASADAAVLSFTFASGKGDSVERIALTRAND